MKINKYMLQVGLFFTTSLTVSSLSFLVDIRPAQACTGFLGSLDPTCPGRIFGRPLESSGSCLQVMTNNVYRVTLINNKNYQQTYYFDDQEFTLSPGYQRIHRKTIASGSNSCNVQNYPMPVVSFDRYANDGTYTERNVRLDSNTTEYVFWRDGNMIKFSSH